MFLYCRLDLDDRGTITIIVSLINITIVYSRSGEKKFRVCIMLQSTISIKNGKKMIHTTLVVQPYHFFQ